MSSWQPGDTLRLDTEHFYLRSVTAEEIDQRYVDWLNDPKVVEFLNARFRRNNLDSIRDYVRRRHDNRNSFHLGIFVRENDSYIGNHTAYCDPVHETAQLGVMIGDRKFWGSGVVTETRTALLDFLFGTMRMHKAFGMPMARNLPAVFNYRQQGFRSEGILKECKRLENGERMDVIVFALFRDDWPPKSNEPPKDK